MNILFIHTNPYYQEINNLIIDIISNYKSDIDEVFERHYQDFRWYNPKELLSLRKYIKKNRINIVHTYNYVDAYYCLKASKYLKIKVVYSCYDYYDDLHGVSKMMFLNVLNKVDYIIFQTDVQRDRFILKYKLDTSKSTKLFHGFSMERYDDFKYESVRDEFFIDDFRYLIGTHGDFEPSRDIMNIFKMVRRLKRTGRNFTCIVSGNYIDEYDDYYNSCKYYYLMQGLENYITYSYRRNDVPNFMSQLDAFVYHSNNEAVSLSVIEAMISGINVIVNDSEMIKEITRNGKYVALYKSNDDLDFAEVTRRILVDLEDYQIIAETVKEECRDLYGIERHIIGLKEIYNKIIIE